MTVTRREALHLTGAMAVLPWLAGCTTLPGRDGPAYAGAVDIHAHVFNAADLAARGFISQAVVGQPQDSDKGFTREIAQFAGALGDIARRLAPSAEAELEAMDRWPTLDEARVEGRKLSPAPDALERAVGRALHRIFRVEDRTDTSHAWVDEIIAGRSFSRVRVALRALPPFADYPAGRGKFAQRAFLDNLAGDLLDDRGLLRNQGPWAKGVVRSRMDIMSEIATLFGQSGSRVGLFVPHQVDFSYWLDDPLPESSSLDRQIALMQRLQDLWNAEESGPLFHGFAGYDPARDVAENGAALARVQDAVMNRGLIGVKLYPVMGFAPEGNLDDPGSYPPSVQAAFEARGLKYRIGSELNAAMDRLFRWAEAEGVPILAHANSSYSANGEIAYRARAHPLRWQPVFERHWDLRVCLAHFGDFNIERGDVCRVDESGFRQETRDRDSVRCTLPWESATIDLMDRFPDRVFTDISYHHLALDPGGRPEWRRLSSWKRAIFQASWQAMTAARPDGGNLIFGTDWFLSGQEEGHDRMLEAVDGFLQDFGLPERAARRRVFRDTALRFLGLVPDASGPQGATWRRLLAYYDSHPDLDPARLERFVAQGT